MHRVVVGTDGDFGTVTRNFKTGQSGITFNESYAEHGFKSG
jgi:hypothetical protein